jgi:CheY-like chemotaxis protein
MMIHLLTLFAPLVATDNPRKSTFVYMTDPILLVEDSPDDVVFLKRALVETGVGNLLHVVVDGQQALDYLAGKNKYTDRATYPLPHLIFLDLKLPRVSGLEVLRWLRAQPEFSRMIVIVLTSSDHPADVKQAYALGANSYLTKPLKPAELTDLVKAVADYWLKRNVAVR